jgi:hypothetical protein
MSLMMETRAVSRNVGDIPYRPIPAPHFKVIILEFRSLMYEVKWVSCHHDIARIQVANGRYDLQIWRSAANILTKQ